ncbi:MAG: hypothetical protein IPK67_08875 [Planctomycetes bacterium]|nr:hypothetical protein [Planctomycetota bacterium]
MRTDERPAAELGGGRTAVLLASVLLLLGGGATVLFVSRTGPGRGEPAALNLPPPEQGSHAEGLEGETPTTPPAQEPRTAEDLSPPAGSAATAPIQEPTASFDLLGQPADWPSWYAGKSIEELALEEQRLRGEHKLELAAEIDKRFAEGRVETYRQGEQPATPIYGVRAGRGDDTHMRFVDMDSTRDPSFFRKEKLANWLLEELRRRRAKHD